MADRAARIQFGTDGWRAVLARDFTFANVRACAEGVCRLLAEDGLADHGLVVGYDTRFQSRAFATEVARVSTAHGITTYLASGTAPTPVVSYNVTHRKAGGAVVITASHNPAEWNGFKYKPEYGGSAPPEVVERLERHIAAALAAREPASANLDAARASGLLIDADLAPPYLANVERTIDLPSIRDAGLRVLVDSMHGAGAGYLASLLDGGSTTVTELRAEENPMFPGMAQPEPIAPNLGPAIAAAQTGGFDVALATDGDADRLGLIDERGMSLTTLQVFALLCLHQLEVRGQRGPLVKSLTQSAMIDKLGLQYGVPVHTTAVGFKFLGPVMMRENALAAGEESGGYAFRGNIPERDGIFSALLLIEMMVRTGKRPSELVDWLYERVGAHHYDRLDVHLAEGAAEPSLQALAERVPERIAGLRVIKCDMSDGARFLLEDGYWGLVRASGTEPLLRIYAEADSPQRVAAIHEELRALAGA